MCRVPLFEYSAVLLALLLPFGRVSAQQLSKESRSAQPSNNPAARSLKICLRLQDDSPFSGLASVHVMPNEGYEAIGTTSESEGEMIFPDIQPGTYMVEAGAPGFLTVRQKVQIEQGHHMQILFVTMKPKPVRVRVPEMSPTSPVADAMAQPAAWIPPVLEEVAPEVDPEVPCPLPQVLSGVGQRMKQFVGNLEKFSANERVEHFVVDGTGARHSPDVRNFEYVVMVSQNSAGTFLLDEYRNGRVDPSQFQAHIATEGLPAMALIFHPLLVPDFQFVCEGLGQWESHPAWQVHFVQRADRPSRIRSYVIGARSYDVQLKGRAWIDPGSYQVVRLETELAKPVKEIELTKEHLLIEYGQVQFHTQKEQLWLPQTVELYVERQGHRYYRRHVFSNFKVFLVETSQSIQPPKESYSFSNASDRDVSGILMVSPVPGLNVNPVSISFTIPARGSTFKLVGPGKDVSIPVESVGSATFTHNGAADSVRVEAHLVKESTLDVIPETPVSSSP
jgi:hypothetical protein